MGSLGPRRDGCQRAVQVAVGMGAGTQASWVGVRSEFPYTPPSQIPDLIWPKLLFFSSRTKSGLPWPVFGSSVTKRRHTRNWERSFRGCLRPRTTWRSTSKKPPAALKGRRPTSSERRWLQLMCPGSSAFREQSGRVQGTIRAARKTRAECLWEWSCSCPSLSPWGGVGGSRGILT